MNIYFSVYNHHIVFFSSSSCSHPALMISGRDPTITTITAAFEKMTAATTLSKGVSEEITPDANLQTSSKEEEREGEGGEAAAAGSTAEDQTPISNSVQSAHYRPAPTVKLVKGRLWIDEWMDGWMD